MYVQPSTAASLNPSGPFSPSYRLLTICLLLSNSAVAFEYMGVATIMPATAEQLGGMHSYGLAFSVFMLAQIMGSTVVGKGDAQFGTKMLFGGGILLFLFGCLLGALAPSWWLFLVARGAQGLGAGAINGVSLVLVAKQYPQSSSSLMLAWLTSAWTLPGLVGPALAGVLAQRLGWRSVFWAIVPLVVMALPMALSSIAPAAHRGPGECDVKGTSPAQERRSLLDNIVVQSAALTFGMALVFSAQGQPPWLFYGLVVTGIASGVWGLARVMPKGTLSFAEGAPSAIWARFFICASYLGSETFVPLGLTHVRGMSLTQAGISLSVGAIFWVAGSTAQVRTGKGDRARRNNAVVGALLLFIGVTLIGAVCTCASLPTFVAAIGWGIGGFGTGISLNAVTSGALARAPEDEKSVVAGSLQIAMSVAPALFSGLGTAWLELGRQHDRSMSQGLSALFAAAAVAALLAVPMSLRAWRPKSAASI